MKELNKEVKSLPDRLKQEWYSVERYYSKKPIEERFNDFKKSFNNFQGEAVEELLNAENVVYKLWEEWKYYNKYYCNFTIRYNTIKNKKCECSMIDKPSKSCDHKKIQKSIKEVWDEFKIYWDYDKEKSGKMFKEIGLLSDVMMKEWFYKYTFRFPHVYENDECYSYNFDYEKFKSKSKSDLWEEFKEIWSIDPENYNEDKLNEMSKYINSVECDNENYIKNYPRNFYEFCEDSNYHSYDSYSILEQYQICKEWEEYAENYECDSDSDSESDDE